MSHFSQPIRSRGLIAVSSGNRLRSLGLMGLAVGVSTALLLMLGATLAGSSLAAVPQGAPALEGLAGSQPAKLAAPGRSPMLQPESAVTVTSNLTPPVDGLSTETPTPAPPPSPAVNAPLVQTDVPLVLQWFSPDSDPTTSIAWGDVDGDGDLDLAVGNNGRPLRVYANEGGTLNAESPPSWVSDDKDVKDVTTSVAWGDVDSDGNLELMAGSQLGLKIYHIDVDKNGHLITRAAKEKEQFSLITQKPVNAFALGDANGDSDLDVAVASGDGIYLYDNKKGEFTLQRSWLTQQDQNAGSVAWADYNGDGKLDLAIGGSSQPDSLNTELPFMSFFVPNRRGATPLPEKSVPGYVRVYRNQGEPGGIPEFKQVWTLPTKAPVGKVVWGDLAGDDRPDLVVGTSGGGTRLFSNQSHLREELPFASSTWTSTVPPSNTSALAIGDFDGDELLDLAIGSTCSTGAPSKCPLAVYRTEGEKDQRRLGQTPVWTSKENVEAFGLAWGDVDGDGDLDLAVGVGGDLGQANRLYRNTSPVLKKDLSWQPSGAMTKPATGLAWGDGDADGHLDLAVGYGDGVRVHGNSGSTLNITPSWQSGSDDSFSAQAVAWGDAGGDGSLELAVGARPKCIGQTASKNCQGGGVRLYARPNKESRELARRPIWTTDGSDDVRSLAWGDVNGDGDLDLAVGKWNAPNQVYYGNGITFSQTISWTSLAVSNTTSVAWGDVDNDGDLDLAVGNRDSANQLYINHGGILDRTPSWQSDQPDLTTSLAWGDVDGDGDLDLAAGNEAEGTRLYRNEKGQLTRSFVWSSLESGMTRNVAWADVDGDGDLDLAVSDQGSLRLYQNEQGVLSGNSVWTVEGCCGQSQAIWGDVDNDGDPDLASAGALFKNQRNDRLKRAGVPIVVPRRPVPGGDADFYSSPVVLSSPSISVTFSISQPYGGRANVRGLYSLDGGGNRQVDGGWPPAKATKGTETTDLLSDSSHKFVWDVAASGLMGRSDNVVFKMTASPVLSPTKPYQVAGPYMFGSSTASTFPFSVRGTQVQVSSDTTGKPVAGALVFRLPKGESAGADPLGNAEGPFVTDAGGYLQGRDTVERGDVLYALWPVSTTLPVSLPWFSYAAYHTSFTPTLGGIQGYTVTQAGVQSLVVQRDKPLVLFNVLMSVEWDPRNDGTFPEDLKAAIKRSSELFFDATNGQMALGNVTVYPNKENWLQSDVVMYANNAIRPRATQGGAVITPTNDISIAGDPIPNAYQPGQVRLGPNWDAYGERGPDLQQDWWQALAHEFGHYFLFLTDDYLGVDEARGLVVGVDCVGSFMTNAYDDSYSEFLDFGKRPPAEWPGECKKTLAAKTTGRSDWATIAKFYPMLNRPFKSISETIIMTGPVGLPLNFTQVTLAGEDQMKKSSVLPADTFDLRGPKGALLQVPHGQIYLFKTHNTESIGDDSLIPLGGTNNTDRIKVRGAELGDRLCVFDNRSEPAWLGCIDEIRNTSSVVELQEVKNWHPDIEVRPTTKNTVRITATLDSPVDRLNVQVLPAYGPPISATAAISSPWGQMEPAAGSPSSQSPVTQTITATQPLSVPSTVVSAGHTTWVRDIVLPYPLFEGTVRLWVPKEKQEKNEDPLREALSQFYLSAGWGPFARGGDPTLMRGLKPFARGGDPTLMRGLKPFARGGDPTLMRGLGPFARGGDPTLLRGLGPFARGGDPTLLRGLGPFARGGDPVPARGYGANNRALGAPVGSADGQVTIFNVRDVMADPGTLSLQALPVAPDVPSYLTPVGQAYRFIASEPLSRTISFNYLGREVPDGYEHPQTLHLYFRSDDRSDHGQGWVRLPGYVDIQQNLVAGPADKSGVYALMTSVDIPLSNSGWNLVSYPILETRLVTDALRSIDGTYTTVYSFDSSSPSDPWKVFDVNAESWVNDDFKMEFGRGYWINVSSPITLNLAVPQASSADVITSLGQTAASGFEELPNPPAIFYGTIADIEPSQDVTKVVTALINDVPCGLGTATRNKEDPSVYGYIVKVAAASPQRAAAASVDDRSKCGVPDQPVTFKVGSELMTTTAKWDNSRPKELKLSKALPPTVNLVSVSTTCRELDLNNSNFELSTGWKLEPANAAARMAWTDGRRALLLDPALAAQPGKSLGLTRASASQVIPLPANVISATLSFWYKTDAAGMTGDSQRARVKYSGRSENLLPLLERSSVWKQVTVPLPKPPNQANQSMELAFDAVSQKPSRTNSTRLAIDEVTVVACTK